MTGATAAHGDSGAAQSRSAWPDRTALVATAVCAAIIACYPLFDYDLYWHLANGREMVAQGRIINEEVFSFTKYGTPFSNHEWLAQVILYLVYDAFGGVGLNAFKILLSGVIACVLYRSCRIAGAPSTVAALVSVIAVFVGIYRFQARPEIFSLLFVVATYSLLFGYRDGTTSPKALISLPALFVIWDWMHGAVFGYVILFAVVSVENIIARLRPPWLAAGSNKPVARDRLRWLNITAGATLLASLLNPYGLRSYDIFLEFLSDNPLVSAVNEFQPPTWSEYWTFYAAAGSTALFALFHWKRLDLTRLLVVVPFAYLAFRYSRATGVFTLVAAPFIASIIGSMGRSGTTSTARWSLQRGIVAVVAVITISYVLYAKFINSDWTYAFGIHELEELNPTGAVAFIKHVQLRGNLYNSGNIGGYLAYHITPERRIFQYNHHTVFGDTTQYIRQPALLDHWDINYAIVTLPGELQEIFPNSQWARIYREPGAVVLLRRNEENFPLIERYELRYFHPGLTDAQLAGMARDPWARPRLILEIADYLAFRDDRRICGLITSGALSTSHESAESAANMRAALKQCATDGSNRTNHEL